MNAQPTAIGACSAAPPPGEDDGRAAAQPQARLPTDGAERAAAPAPHRQRRERRHDGQITVDARNPRWTSDGFEIACGTARTSASPSRSTTCDREAMAWRATTGGITGEMIRDLMVESVEHRFDGRRTACTAIEWLSDNGSCYRAHETRHFARDLGLVPCFTPVRKPRSATAWPRRS